MVILGLIVIVLRFSDFFSKATVPTTILGGLITFAATCTYWVAGVILYWRSNTKHRSQQIIVALFVLLGLLLTIALFFIIVTIPRDTTIYEVLNLEYSLMFVGLVYFMVALSVLSRYSPR
jgi:hypothetical protein